MDWLSESLSITDHRKNVWVFSVWIKSFGAIEGERKGEKKQLILDLKIKMKLYHE